MLGDRSHSAIHLGPAPPDDRATVDDQVDTVDELGFA
jgi:hypothetical protein